MNRQATDLTAHERAGIITRDLMEGDRLTTHEIAERIGLTKWGAQFMMYHLSRVLPIYLTDDHVWVWCEESLARF